MIDFSFKENPYDDRVKNYLQFIYENKLLILIKENSLQIYDENLKKKLTIKMINQPIQI